MNAGAMHRFHNPSCRGPQEIENFLGWPFPPLILRGGVFILLFLYLGILSLTGCQRSKPVDLKPGEHSCGLCQMNIVDLRFKAEILTKKGKVQTFDSIECMIGWWMNHREETATRWVSDFYAPEKWIPLEKAFILKADKLASPMGASLSAYSSEESVQKAQREYGGKRFNFKDLENYIQFEWKKEISKEAMPVH